MRFQKILRLIMGLVFLGLVFPHKTNATRSLSFTTDRSTISGDDQMSVTASISGFTNGEPIYIKGAFYKDNPTPNYFGLTQNNGNWIKNSDPTTNQRQISIGSWDGNLIVKPDFTDTGYANYGDGSFKFKVGFYYLTSSGNLSLVNWSTNIIDVSLNAPTPIPTQAPTSVPTNSPSPNPTNSPVPTNSPTHSASSGSTTPTSSLAITSVQSSITPLDTISEISPTDGITQAVLGENSKLRPTPKTSPILIAGTRTVPWIGIVLVALGIIIMGGCAILIFHPIDFESIWTLKK